MLHGEIVGAEHGLPRVVFVTLLICHLMLAHLDVVFPRQIAQGVPVAELLMLHYEIDRTAPFATTETFANSLGPRYRERRGALVVERAQTYIVGATPLQAHEIRHNLHNVGCVDDTLYGLPVNNRFFHFQHKVNEKPALRQYPAQSSGRPYRGGQSQIA